MATVTATLGLTLPIGTEKVSRAIINGNMQLIDSYAATTNAAIADVNGKLRPASITSVSSLADLKTYLTGVYGSISDRQSIIVSFQTLFSDDYFTNYGTYQGFLNRIAPHYFSCSVTGVNGIEIVFGYNNDVWTIERLAPKSDVPKVNISNTYINGGVKTIIVQLSMSFTNGVAETSVSTYKGASETYTGIAFAVFNNTASLYVTAAFVDSSTNKVTVKCQSTYTGTSTVNVMMFAH